MISTSLLAYVSHDVYSMFIQPTLNINIPITFFMGLALLLALYTYKHDPNKSVADSTTEAWALLFAIWLISNCLFKIIPYFS
jgi:hypothetical protein